MAFPPCLQPKLPPPSPPLVYVPSSSPSSPSIGSDVVSWTRSIARHARSGNLTAAKSSFINMISSGVTPNPITLATLLSACADDNKPQSSSLFFGRALHAYAFKLCIDHYEDIVLATALIDVYAKSFQPGLSRQVFDKMPQHNSICLNTMIAGHMRNGEIDLAVSLFRQMERRDKVSWTVIIDGCVKNGILEDAIGFFLGMLVSKDVEPDYVTVVAVLSACAGLGALAQGMWMHKYVMERRDLHENVRVGNALIDMYSQCGCADFAHQVFEEMSNRTGVSWNSMIAGFAMNGCCPEALDLFEKMPFAGFQPDSISFTGALTACSHAGLVDKGLRYYEKMKNEYGIKPRMEHYGCVVDLLGRAARLEDAVLVVKSMPFKPNEVVLGALLSACRMHGDVSMAEGLMDCLVELEPDTDSNYILLSNTYAAVGRWDNVEEVRSRMKNLGIRKNPGISAIEIGRNVHEFVAGDKRHPKTDDIYNMLELLGYEMNVIE